ncbi:MAG: peptidoglycan editing factor PgeF [Bacteroidota bacterium]|jgi:YfiH family protein
MKVNNQYPHLLHFNIFEKHTELFGFTTTIAGGVSKGNYASFNLGMYGGDEIASVAQNREHLSSALGIEEENLITPYQTHEDKILVVDSSFLEATDLEKSKLSYAIDAIITNKKNIGIGVGTADCVPILLYDPAKQVLAAVHAGWRGTVLKIAKKTVEKMIERFGCEADNIIAGIGPSISCEYFEVGDEVVETFNKSDFQIQDIGYKNEATGKMHLDLWKANQFLLVQSGISIDNIEISGLCTYSNPSLFFSARRQTIHSGRMITGGVLK